MKIAGVASALPRHRYAQEVITAALKHHWNGSLERPELQERLHSRAGVEYRHLAFPLEQYARFGSWGETNAAWLEVAQELGARARSMGLSSGPGSSARTSTRCSWFRSRAWRVRHSTRG